MPERKSGLSTWFVILISLLAKSSKLVGLLKVAKPMMLFGSMAISAIVYAFFLGPWLAILFIALLLIHEMGHVVAMRMKGYDTPTPVFIPFFGAAIFAPKFTDRDTEAFVGYGGPVLGTIGALAVFGAYFFAPEDSALAHILLVASFLGVMLNLFNLLPISPLDGGRVTQATSKWFKFIGLGLLALISVLWKEPVVLYIWIIVLFDLDLIPIKARAVLVSICWISMVSLFVFGFGSQSLAVSIIDSVLTAILVALTIWRAVDSRFPEEEKDVRPNLPGEKRILWLLLYVGLAIVLVGTLFFQAPLLPQNT